MWNMPYCSNQRNTSCPGREMASDTTRCVNCHAAQVEDAQHGRSTTSITAGQDCASCHPAEVITEQHNQVEQNIKNEVARINEIVSEYRKNPLITVEEKRISQV